MKPKTYPAFFKVLDQKAGIVEQYCAVFNNVDLIGDRVIPGFFQDAVAFVKAGGSLPVIYSHQWDNLDAWIGEVQELEEVLPGDARLPEKLKAFGGLRSVWKADLEEPYARKVLKLMARGQLRQGSFSYGVDEERKAKDGANELIRGQLIEIGPTLRGMNDLTDTVSVKADVEELDAMMRARAEKATEEAQLAVVQAQLGLAAATAAAFGTKAGRVLSAKNESKLQQIADLAEDVLSSVRDEGTVQTADNGKAEEAPVVDAEVAAFRKFLDDIPERAPVITR